MSHTFFVTSGPSEAIADWGAHIKSNYRLGGAHIIFFKMTDHFFFFFFFFFFLSFFFLGGGIFVQIIGGGGGHGPPCPPPYSYGPERIRVFVTSFKCKNDVTPSNALTDVILQ